VGGQPPTCSKCPLFNVGKGFVLGSGDPKTAKVALLLEAPGSNELHWEADVDEITRRRERFPEMEGKFLKYGMPVVGKAGGILFGWGLNAVQLHRRDLFIDNVLRCLPPKEGDSPYPKGDVRKSAEAHCRQYDRWNEFSPTVALVQIHPAAIAREPAPLPLMIQTFYKAKDFHLTGERPVVLCGGKAAKMWLGHSETVQTWLGHYEPETELSASNREKRREIGMATRVGPKEKNPRKLTTKSALKLLLDSAIPFQYGDDGSLVGYEVNTKLSSEQYAEMVGLLVPKPKKEKA